MSVQHYHGMCKRYIGKAVMIRTVDGRVHRGVIKHVDQQKVYLQPLGGATGAPGGYGYGWGYGGFGFGTGILLGTIIGLSLIPFFFI